MPLFGRRFALYYLTARRTLRTAIVRRANKRIVYSEHGDPSRVLRLEIVDEEDKQLENGEVKLKWLAAPVNMADLAQIHGFYGVERPKLPAVAGFEGVASVEQVGPSVSNLRSGDWVIPKGLGPGGTWRSGSVTKASEVYRLKRRLEVQQAASLLVNPPTALLLLRNYAPLRQGDVLIQNGANSHTGRLVIQLARRIGVKTVNLIRDRPNVQQTKDELMELGADLVLAESDLRGGAAVNQGLRQMDRPVLALNCVGGATTVLLTSALKAGGKLVTYGAMGRDPMQVPAGPLIFKGVEMHGFWLARYFEEREDELNAVLDELSELLAEKQLLTEPFEEHSIENFKSAVGNAQKGGRGKKQMIRMNAE